MCILQWCTTFFVCVSPTWSLSQSAALDSTRIPVNLSGTLNQNSALRICICLGHIICSFWIMYLYSVTSLHCTVSPKQELLTCTLYRQFTHREVHIRVTVLQLNWSQCTTVIWNAFLYIVYMHVQRWRISARLLYPYTVFTWFTVHTDEGEQ